jgi:hypothetical protein
MKDWTTIINNGYGAYSDTKDMISTTKELGTSLQKHKIVNDGLNKIKSSAIWIKFAQPK